VPDRPREISDTEDDAENQRSREEVGRERAAEAVERTAPDSSSLPETLLSVITDRSRRRYIRGNVVPRATRSPIGSVSPPVARASGRLLRRPSPVPLGDCSAARVGDISLSRSRHPRVSTENSDGDPEDERSDRNVLGGELEPCGTDPVTGYRRDGHCRDVDGDVGEPTPSW